MCIITFHLPLCQWVNKWQDLLDKKNKKVQYLQKEGEGKNSWQGIGTSSAQYLLTTPEANARGFVAFIVMIG